ncbi:MAG: amidase family protein, partial [Alphaproteobacteria bacterium]
MDVAVEALRRIVSYKDPAVWTARVPESEVMARARALTAVPLDAEKLPLYGIPFAVKDKIDCAGLPTPAACPAFAYEPARDARVIERLLAAGAILIGKTNLDQFATGLVGTHSPYGAPRCVFDDRYITGGSSSGSAVVAAAGLVAFALGTDTAGSGRVPAAFNNIVGWKPTRGLLSAAGVVPPCRSLDCVSIFAHSAGDAAEVARLAQDFDPADPFSRRAEARALPQASFRFGVLTARDREFFGDEEMAALYDAAIAKLAGLGGEPIEIDLAPFQA